MRYTEYHGDIAVIKDKSKHKEAMKRLAQFEDCAGMQEKFCDQYCHYQYILNEDELMDKCCDCKIAKLLRLLEEVGQ